MKPLLTALGGSRSGPPPIWMMRQAGRHLPEYLELRSRARDFLDFCYSPSLAAEATLQPIRRYGMDGAILFADILLVLDAMGLGVRFEKGVGPLVEVAESPADLARVPVAKAVARLAPVSETVSRVRAALPSETTLIGFAGSPWTVLLYALEGRGKTDQRTARLFPYEQPGACAAMLAQLTEVTAQYLAAQVEAGADCLMLFDSWAGGLAGPVFDDVVIAPTKALVARLRELDVSVPVTGFPKGAGAGLGRYAEATGVTAVGLGTDADPVHVNAALPPSMCVQGHLDPLALVSGGQAMEDQVRAILHAYRDRPHIFNLGHGVVPETPIAHVERVVELVREGG